MRYRGNNIWPDEQTNKQMHKRANGTARQSNAFTNAVVTGDEGLKNEKVL